MHLLDAKNLIKLCQKQVYFMPLIAFNFTKIADKVLFFELTELMTLSHKSIQRYERLI